MNTSTSRDITHCAMDSSRYCRVLPRKPLAPVSGWKIRAEMPILSVRCMMRRPALSDIALKRAASSFQVCAQGVSRGGGENDGNAAVATTEAAAGKLASRFARPPEATPETWNQHPAEPGLAVAVVENWIDWLRNR